jgi:hypothetical protein
MGKKREYAPKSPAKKGSMPRKAPQKKGVCPEKPRKKREYAPNCPGAILSPILRGKPRNGMSIPGKGRSAEFAPFLPNMEGISPDRSPGTGITRNNPGTGMRKTP